MLNMDEKNGNNQLVEQTGEAPASSPDKEKRLGVSMLTRVALAVVVIASLIISVTCVMKFNQLEAEKQELQAKLDDYNQKIAELQYLLNQPMNEEYIVRVAKERLGLYFPDEVIYYNKQNPTGSK